jgi:hypothetical protein
VGANSSWGATTLLTGDADITVAENLTTEASPPAGTSVVVVGFQFASADATISAPGGGTLPSLTATAKDLTQLGVIPGEHLFIGGDAAITQFATAADQGFVRARSVAAGAITLDKTPATFVTDAGTGKTIQVFLARVLKNEVGTAIVERTYQLERTLGAPDTSFPTQLQAEYLVGAYANQMTITASTASKLEADMSFVALDSETRTSTDGLKAGTRPTLADADLLNTSSDISRIKLAVVTDGESAPSPLFAIASELTIEINNGVTPDKGLGTLGAIGVSLGDFVVTGSIEAYFTTVEAIAAVRESPDVTIEVHYVKDNAGVSMDLPLIALGDGRLNVEKDRSVKIPLAMEAATGAKIDTNLNHTALFMFWDYLPSIADV